MGSEDWRCAAKQCPSLRGGVCVRQALARLNGVTPIDLLVVCAEDMMDHYENSRCTRFCLLCLEVCGRRDWGVVGNHDCKIIGSTETGGFPTCTVCLKKAFTGSVLPKAPEK